MVTRVEVGSITSLTVVPGLGDISKEETLKRTYFCQTSDTSGTPLARVREGKSVLRSPATSFPLPRLAPKPFSKEPAPDGRGLVLSVQPGPDRGASAGIFHLVATENLEDRMPSLAEQEAGGDKAARNGPRGAGKVVDLWPSPSPVTLFETNKASPTLGTGASQRTWETNVGVSQEPPSSCRPEVAPKPTLPSRKPPGTLPRPASLCQDTRSTAPPDEAGQGRPLPKACSMEDTARHALLEPRPRTKRRPVSAIFTEALQPLRPGADGEAVAEKVAPEKTWVRKPRPLSMDLTAKFETREALLRKVAEEGTRAQLQGPQGTDLEPRVDGANAIQAEALPQDPDSDFLQVTRKIREQKDQRAETARLVPREDRSPQEERVRPDPKPEKVPEAPLSRPGRGLGPVEVKSGGADQGPSEGAQWTSRGSVKKRLSLFEEESILASALGSEPSAAASEAPVAVPELEKAGVSVQARIKGWAANSTEGKPEIRRGTLQARPLSADLTKLFSSSAPSSEVRHEKCATPSSELPSEQREKHGSFSPAPRSPWKPGVPQRTSGQMENKGGSGQDPSGRRGESSVPSQVSPEDDGSFQTVWATVFEHHVERHTVAGQSGLAPAPREVTNVSEPRVRPEKGAWSELDQPEVTSPKRESARWPESPEPGKMGQASLRQRLAPVMERQASAQIPSLDLPVTRADGPPSSRRVEPRYDVLHTTGERAHSEAITTALEDTAVTLHSGRSWPSLQDRQPSQEAVPEEHSPKAHVGSVQRASLIWGARGQEASGPKPSCREPKDTLGDSRLSTRGMGGAVVNWHKPTAGVCEDPCPKTTSSRAISEAKHQGPIRIGDRPGGHTDGGPARSGPSSRPEVEPRDSRARVWPDTLSVHKGTLVAASEGDPSPGQVPEPEARMRKAGSADVRVDRWRRRTLPHDTKFSLLAPENSGKAERRQTDTFTHTAAVLEKPPVSPCGAGTQEVTSGALQDRACPRGKPRSPAEPKVTFFALTYQIPDRQKTKSTVTSGPERLPERSGNAVPPPSPPAFPQAPTGSGHWAQGDEGRRADRASQSPMAVGCPSSSGHRAARVGTLCTPWGTSDGASFQSDQKDSGVRMSSVSATQSSLVLRSRPTLPVRRRTEVISETFPGKMRDGYRCSVLDIDALMAQYKDQSASVPGEAQEQDSPTTEPSSSPWERSGRLVGAEWGRRSPREAPKAEGLWKRASVAGPACSGTPGSGLWPAESAEVSATPKFSPPLWEPSHLAPAESDLRNSSVPAGPRKKVSGAAEEEHKAFVCKGQDFLAKAKPSGREDPSSGARVSPTDQKTGTPRKPIAQTEDGAALRGDPHRDCGRSALDIRRPCSDKGAPARVHEGLQGVRQRKLAQQEGRPSLPEDTSEASVGPCRWEPRIPDRHGVSLGDLKQDNGSQDNEQPLRPASPVTAGPQRSQSFCKDKREGLIVDQLKQCFSRRAPESKDTDSLVQDTDGHYGTWAEQCPSGDSLAPESPSPDSAALPWKQPPSRRPSSPSSATEATSGDTHGGALDPRSTGHDRSSSEPESTDGTEGTSPPDAHPRRGDDFAFIDQTSVLDSSALKTRVQLRKRSHHRAPISHTLRRSRGPLEEEVDSAWMFKDSTEEKPSRREESDEEEKPSRAEKTPVSHPQRVPVFPGMDPAMLKAQLHKRPEVDSPGETPSWTPQSKSPKSPFQPGVLGSRVLPSGLEKDERSEDPPSPQWLRELKSRKRQSLYENQA